ncbi:hypothetical protein QPK87_35090 [Kamptonema cortianum]|nr:hypothetical protein [Kamptonema cortianum]
MCSTFIACLTGIGDVKPVIPDASQRSAVSVTAAREQCGAAAE